MMWLLPAAYVLCWTIAVMYSVLTWIGIVGWALRVTRMRRLSDELTRWWVRVATVPYLVGLPFAVVFAVVEQRRALVAFDVLMLVANGVVLWVLWKRDRRNRKGNRSRVLGVVRDLGHRLTVAPVPAGSRA